jgi:hypothetical protein
MRFLFVFSSNIHKDYQRLPPGLLALSIAMWIRVKVEGMRSTQIKLQERRFNKVVYAIISV